MPRHGQLVGHASSPVGQPRLAGVCHRRDHGERVAGGAYVVHAQASTPRTASSATRAAWACSRSSTGRGDAVARPAASRGRTCGSRPTSSGQPSSASTSSAREQLPVVARLLGEAQPGVEDHPLARDPGGLDRVEPLAQLAAYGLDDAVGPVVGEVAHPVGVGAPVHRDVGRLAAGDDVEDPRVGEPAGDVVDDLRARRRAPPRRPRRASCRPETTAPPAASSRITGTTRSSSSATSGPGGAGTGGLAADVEDVGALRQQGPAVGDGAPRWCRSGRRRRRSRG